MAAVLSEQQAHSLIDRLLSKYGNSSNEARKVLLEMYQQRVEKAWPGLGWALTIDSAGVHLNLRGQAVSDLSPLRGMPLTSLDCGQTRITDLTPLRGMPLTSLSCNATPILDLSPLQGMSLVRLNCNSTQVADLSPLKGMPLTSLGISGTKIPARPAAATERGGSDR